MKKMVFDRKMLEEARNIMMQNRKMLEEKLLPGWKLTTLFAPIQYERTFTLGKKRYLGYLRSRWGHPFSAEIYEKKKGRKFKLIFSHKSVDKEENNPPLKSMKIIDMQLKKMKEAEKKGEKNI